MTGAFDALAPPASGLRRGALGATRRMLPASVKNGLKRLVARWAPFVVERAAVRRAEEDDRLWGSLQADGLPDLEGPGSNTDN